MARLIMWNMMTLDGFFEGPKSWDLDWHNDVWGEDMNKFSLEQLDTAGALLFGRRTYEGMASYWASAKADGPEGDVARVMNTIPKVVFSRTLKRADWSNTRLVSADAEAEVVKLKEASEKDLFVFGSGDLSATLMKAGLFDELRIGLNPLVLGVGGPLFKPSPLRTKMRLLEARPMKSGLVLLRYQPLPVA
jgi:dihydrofolate reductase